MSKMVAVHVQDISAVVRCACSAYGQAELGDTQLKYALAAMSTFTASLPDLGIEADKAPQSAAVIVDSNKRKYRLLPEESSGSTGQATMQVSCSYSQSITCFCAYENIRFALLFSNACEVEREG